MAMLAEPRRKVKYSTDPRGLAWKNDGNKFGQKLMEKMGWNEGKGLGANEDGSVDSIAVRVKNDNRGVGCSKKHIDNWIEHQDDFNSLLANLNADHSDDVPQETRVTSLEEKSKAAKKRVHYQKFTRGKDLSTYRTKDLDCIFGRRKKADIETPKSQSEANSEDERSGSQSDTATAQADQSEHGVMTITSEQSVQQYFAQKMAALKEAREPNTAQDSCKQAIDKDDAKTTSEEKDDKSSKKKKKKKSKRGKSDSEEQCHSASSTADSVPHGEPGEPNTQVNCNSVNDSQVEENMTEKVNKKKKKKRKVEIAGDLVQSKPKNDIVDKNELQIVEEKFKTDSEAKKSKKKKSKGTNKLPNETDCQGSNAETSDLQMENCKSDNNVESRSQRKKKRKADGNSADISGCIAEPRSKKKKLLTKEENGEQSKTNKLKKNKNSKLKEVTERSDELSSVEAFFKVLSPKEVRGYQGKTKNPPYKRRGELNTVSQVLSAVNKGDKKTLKMLVGKRKGK